MKIYLLLLLALLGFVTTATTQIVLERSVVGSAGSHFENGELNLSWTIGENLTTTLENNDLMIDQGFQKGFDIINWTIDPKITIQLNVYPNPTSDLVFFKGDIDDTFKVRVFDITGRLVIQDSIRISQQDSSLDLQELQAGMFIIQFTHPNYLPFTFKIQKT